MAEGGVHVGVCGQEDLGERVTRVGSVGITDLPYLIESFWPAFRQDVQFGGEHDCTGRSALGEGAIDEGANGVITLAIGG
jgi:hypothetical protein